MIKIWFEPHATTLDNEASRASGWNDVDLSELGLRQAKEMVERCKQRSIDVIICSDLQRAVKSAIPTADEMHIPVYVDKRLRECDYGDFTLKPKVLIDEQRLKRINEPFPNGESYADCMARMTDFINWLKQNFDGKTILIIGHRATHYGLDHIINSIDLQKCLSEKFKWQPGWEYELK